MGATREQVYLLSFREVEILIPRTDSLGRFAWALVCLQFFAPVVFSGSLLCKRTERDWV